MKIQNSHDKIFKETFSDIRVAKDFIQNYLPASIMKIIDIETLVPQKDSHIDNELKETFSDLLFEVNINNNNGYIYFLFEHKSYTSKNVAFQLLKYMVEIWESKIKKQQINELPIIIPLVIYHGKDQWHIKTGLGEMIQGYADLPDDIKEYIPNYKYLLYDISRYTDEDIKGIAQLRVLFTVLRDIFSEDKNGLRGTIALAARTLQELDDKQTGVEYFETFLRYIFNASKDFDEEDIIKIIAEIEPIYPEGSEVIMTTAEMLKKVGKQEGMEEGMKKGLRAGLSKTAIKLLTKKFGSMPENTKENIRQLDTETLEIIIGDIFAYESLTDIDKFLRQY